MPSRVNSLLKSLGPGLLYAGAAIGVSHLVQSTRAGAEYGFAFIGLILLTNFLKFPFFEYGPRYAQATGESLVEGYNRLGKWALALFIVLTLSTMFTIQAAVTIVTAGLAATLFGIELSPVIWCAILLGICLIVLLVGKFNFLNRLMKFIILALTITTIIAVLAALRLGVDNSTGLSSVNWEAGGLAFLIALLGWMPAPIDISVWHSVWSLEDSKSKNQQIDLKESRLDFHIGYWGTTFLAICFLSLGALVMHKSGESLSDKGFVFASQLIDLYTLNLGNWTYIIIGIAAFTTMFSTTITCLDASPRVLNRTSQLFISSKKKSKKDYYWLYIIILATGTVVLLAFLKSSMQFMVNLATSLSFLTAPLLAFINFKLVRSKHMPEKARPQGFIVWVSYLGLIFLGGLAIIYLGIKAT